MQLCICNILKREIQIFYSSLIKKVNMHIIEKNVSFITLLFLKWNILENYNFFVYYTFYKYLSFILYYFLLVT